MKKFKAVQIIALLSIFFYSCEGRVENETMGKESDLFKYGIQTIEHDGCEYIIFKDISHSDVEMLHKTNCKFCLTRK